MFFVLGKSFVRYQLPFIWWKFREKSICLGRCLYPGKVYFMCFGQELLRNSRITVEELPPFEPDAFFYRLMALILLPWLFLVRVVRNTPWLSIIILSVIFMGGAGSWNYFDLTLKILHYVSLLCGVYALLWLLKELPFQRKKRLIKNI